MIHWHLPVEMQPEADSNAWQASLELGPGTYGYKFSVADGEWELDRDNPRTRSWMGVRNSLLVVSGADEPVLHAPSMPWVFVGDDGRLCVRAGVRKGAASELSLLVDDGAGWRTLRMRPAAMEDEHELFEAQFPVPGKGLDYLFLLPDGKVVGRTGGPGIVFRLDVPSLTPACPSWWRDAVVYTIFVDRFRRGGVEGRWESADRGTLHDGIAGGNLDGIIEALPYLTELGVTVLHVTPVARAASSHRYDAIDPRSVDPRLGGESAFKRLVDAVHARGLRLVADLPLTHVHRDFFAFRDVCENGPASAYWEWFRILRYPFGMAPVPDYQHYQKGRWEEPLLQLDHPEVQDYLAGTLAIWAARGVDGFRLDAAADLPLELVHRLVQTAKRINPEAVLFGELTVDNGYRWLGAGLHAVTEFGVQQVIHDLLWRRTIGAAEAARRLARLHLQRGGPSWTSMAFTATHDQPRLLTLVGDRRRAMLGHLLVLGGASLPALYYGDEVGLCSAEPGREFEDAWPDRMPMPWGDLPKDDSCHEWFRRALKLRKTCLALRQGDELHLAPECGANDVLIVRRTHPSERVDVIVHAGDGWVRLRRPPFPDPRAAILLETGEVRLEGNEIVLGPWSGAVVGCVG